MPTRHNSRLLLLCLVLALPVTGQAGSSMRSAGEGFASFGLATDLGNRIFDKQSERVSGNCDPGQAANFYGEYGWSYHTTIFAGGTLRHQNCNSDQWGAEGGQIGIARRIDPFSNALVWETKLLLPSQRLGNASSAHDMFGLESGIHYHPRPDAYNLDSPIDPLDANWDFGLGVRAWFSHLPQELRAYAQYTLPLRETNWNLGQRGWTSSFRLDYSRSLATTHSTTPFAIDSHDKFWRLDGGVSFRHVLSKFSALSIGFSTSLAGQNASDVSAIKVQYEKIFPK